MGRILRSHRPGHIGYTPQDTDEIVAGGRVAGMLEDFAEHRERPPRVDDDLGRPALEQAAASNIETIDFQTTALAIGGSVARSLSSAKRWPDGKHLGGYDPRTEL